MGGHNCQPMPRHLSLLTKVTTTDGDVGVYQRVITLTFKDELSKEAITNYLQPVIKEQGEAYGLIAMTCARINQLSVVDTYYWPDYDTFEKAKNEYAGKFVEATRKAGAKVDIKEAYVYRAWFDGTEDMKSLTNF